MSTTISTKVQNTMRSLFRLMGFKEMHSPNILIQQEEQILSQRISQLNSEEINCFVNAWPLYYKNQLVQQEVDDHHFNNQVEKELQELN